MGAEKDLRDSLRPEPANAAPSNDLPHRTFELRLARVGALQSVAALERARQVVEERIDRSAAQDAPPGDVATALRKASARTK